MGLQWCPKSLSHDHVCLLTLTINLWTLSSFSSYQLFSHSFLTLIRRTCLSYFFGKITIELEFLNLIPSGLKIHVFFKLFFLYASPKEGIDVFFLKLMPLPMFATFSPLKHCSINYSVCWIFQTSAIGFFPWSYRRVQIATIFKKFKIKPYLNPILPKVTVSFFSSSLDFLEESIFCFYIILSYCCLKLQHPNFYSNSLTGTAYLQAI